MFKNHTKHKILGYLEKTEKRGEQSTHTSAKSKNQQFYHSREDLTKIHKSGRTKENREAFFELGRNVIFRAGGFLIKSKWVCNWTFKWTQEFRTGDYMIYIHYPKPQGLYCNMHSRYGKFNNYS